MANTVNPTPEEINAMPIESTYDIVGVLESMVKVPGRYSDDIAIVIVTEDGARYDLRGFQYPLTYESGALDNLRGKTAQTGETIQITAHVVLKDGKRQTTIGYEHARLLKPSDDRQHQYDLLHDRIHGKLRTLLDLVPTGRPARKAFAELNKLALTKDERAQLMHIVSMMVPGDAPIVGSSYDRNALEKAYGVNTDELCKSEFLEFARGVLHGEIPNADKPNRADQSYLFHYLQAEPFTTDEFMELVSSTLKVRIARLEKTGDSHDETWDDSYLAERCIETLTYVEHKDVVATFGWMIDYCLERDYFDYRYSADEEGPDRKFYSFLSKTVRALHDYAIHHNGRIGKDFDAGRLRAWHYKLSAYPFMGQAAEEIRASIVPLTTV
jgi:hypothetical protein